MRAAGHQKDVTHDRNTLLCTAGFPGLYLALMMPCTVCSHIYAKMHSFVLFLSFQHRPLHTQIQNELEIIFKNAISFIRFFENCIKSADFFFTVSTLSFIHNKPKHWKIYVYLVVINKVKYQLHINLSIIFLNLKYAFLHHICIYLVNA